MATRPLSALRSPIDRADLVSPSPSRRAGAVEALGEEASPEHLGALLAALGDPSASVRVRAVEALFALAISHPRPLGTVRRVLSKRLGTDASARVKARIALSLEGLEARARGAPAKVSGERPAGAAPPRAARPRRPRPKKAPLRSFGAPPLAVALADGGDHDCYYGGCDYGEDAEPTWSFPDDDGLDQGPLDPLAQRWAARLFSSSTAEPKPTLEQLIPTEQLARLRARLAPTPSSSMPAEVQAFSRRHGVELDRSRPASTLAELAMDALASLYGSPLRCPHRWGELGALLRSALASPPPGDEDEKEVVVLALHAALASGPGELREAVAEARWESGWLPLSPWLGMRKGGEGGEGGERSHGLAMVERVRAVRGSTLAQRNVLEAHGAGLPRSPLAPWADHQAHFDEQARALLLAGGGSLRSLGYPSFRVVGRVTLVELSAGQEQALGQIASDLERARSFFEAPASAVASLLSWLSAGRLEGLEPPAQRGLVEAVERSALAYVALRREAPGSERLRRSVLLSCSRRPGFSVGPGALAEARARSLDRLIEGVVAGLLAELHQPHAVDSGKQAQLKELLIEASRAASACYAWSPLPALAAGDAASAQRLIDALLQRLEHAPLELAQALGLDPRQGLPRLGGGQASPLEQRFARAHREAMRGRKVGEGRSYECRPIGKREALLRGELGRDCSSSAVPLRALSPHHVYYGLFDEAGEQLPGYMTVFEAWAKGDDGEARPMLCLETINEPRGLLSGAQQDLLVLFEAVALGRGLSPGLVLVSGHGTWNYANGAELARSRRSRQGSPVRLSPADPVVYRIYERFFTEARYYSAFGSSTAGELLTPGHDGGAPAMVLLAPFDPARDRVADETLAEARRLASLPRRELTVTSRDERGATVGFVSADSSG